MRVRSFLFWGGMAQLTAKQLMFVSAYVGAANGNATEAARIAGYAEPNKQGPRLLVNVGVAEHVAEFRSRIEAEGIANQQNRIDAYNKRWKLLEQIRKERSEDDFLSDVPGGSTGFVVKVLKNVKHQYIPDADDEDGKESAMVIETWESAVDTGFLKEFRELEKQAAQDLGQWTEKREITGHAGGPIEITEVEVTRTVRPVVEATD